MKSNFDLEQIQLLTEVDDIHDKPKPKGYKVCVVISRYIQCHLPADYKVAGPNSYVEGISTEFDLLVVRAEAEPRVGAYEPSDVRVVLEVKTTGIKAKRQNYPLEIEKIRKIFDEAKMKNTKIWGALLTCYGTIHPVREISINYEDLRKRGLEPYNYGVYTLADGRRDKPEWGKWEEFIKGLLSKLN